jgi:phenylalanyl-tRNA synthetase beta chain
MNVSTRWLRTLAPDIDADPDTLAQTLAGHGFPVEGTTHRSALLDDIVVARVVETGPHPNADRLSLCQVDDGSGELHAVVCGAPNVRGGATYPFIPVGGVLPGGMKIRKAKIRGEVSHGMLCSAKELGLGIDHSGILELRGDHAPGTPLLQALGLDGDALLDVEVTANRGDLLSHVGVAREVAPGGVATISLPELPGAPALDGVTWVEGDEEVEVDGVSVRVDDADGCRRFTGAVIRGVRVGPSPDWLQARLRSIGARPINNVVDATNFVLFELGQPTHAYDLGRLAGGAAIARRARPGESMVTLDGEERVLSPEMLVIADAEQPVNIAGIMGEDRSSVTAQTRDVFVECAAFEPTSIRRTKKDLGIASDAGYRFERWVDPTAQRQALLRVVQVILATAGGDLHPRLADVHPRPWSAPTIPLRLARVGHVLGVDFDADAVTSLLAPLGFEVASGEEGDVLRVTVPGWRGYDVTREVDLIEEVARRHGYDAFPDEARAYRPNTVPDHPLFALEDDVRRMLAARGLFEAQTPAFVPEAEGSVRLSNPLSSEEPVLRRVLLPSLLRRLERNLARGVRDVRLFEVGTAFSGGGGGRAPDEEPRVAAVLTGARAPEHWSGRAEALDLWDLKAVLEALAVRAHPGARVVPGAPDGGLIVPPLGFTVEVEGAPVGHGGVVNPSALDVPPWAGEVLGLELALPPDPAERTSPRYRPLPTHPAVTRDLALLVPTDVPAASVRRVARDATGTILESLWPFDLYDGEGLADGVRSLAWRFRFRAPDRTLTDDEVERHLRAIVDRLGEELGVHIRG